MRCALLATTMVAGLLLHTTAFAQSADPTAGDVEKFLNEAEAALSAGPLRRRAVLDELAAALNRY